MINVEVLSTFHQRKEKGRSANYIEYVLYHRWGMQRTPDKHWNSVSAQLTDPIPSQTTNVINESTGSIPFSPNQSNSVVII